jgi:tripartite-type tricarboxylate transporter receptor subunit TctC
MQLSRTLTRWTILAGAALCAATQPAQASDTYPSKPVRIIVPFNAGGSTDVVARAVAQRLTKELDSSFIVENKAGGGSAIGTAQVARSTPDGYTLLFTTSYLSLNYALMKNPGYDPVKDFSPVSNLAFMPMVLLVKADLPVKTVADVIKLAKAKPNGLNYSSSGVGGPPHFAGVTFNNLAGVQITHIPYNGAAPALVDVASGLIDMSFSTFSSALPLLKGGKVRAIAVASKERFPEFPDVPTFTESGLPGMDMPTMYALLAPANTPKPIVDKLYGVMARAAKDPAMRKLIAEQGGQVVGNSPQELAAFVREDVARWNNLVKTTPGVQQQ